MSCTSNSESQIELDSPGESSGDAEAKLGTNLKEWRRRLLGPSKASMNAKAAIGGLSPSIGASGASTGTSGTNLYNTNQINNPPWPHNLGLSPLTNWPPAQAAYQPLTLEDILGMSNDQKLIQQLIAQMQAQLAAKKSEETEKLRRMSKQDLAREALKEMGQIRERLDTLTVALTTICLEPDEVKA